MPALAQHHQQPDHRQAEGHRPGGVEATGGASDRAGRITAAATRASADGDGAEPEGGVEVEDLGDQPGERVAESGRRRRR